MNLTAIERSGEVHCSNGCVWRFRTPTAYLIIMLFYAVHYTSCQLRGRLAVVVIVGSSTCMFGEAETYRTP